MAECHYAVLGHVDDSASDVTVEGHETLLHHSKRRQPCHNNVGLPTAIRYSFRDEQPPQQNRHIDLMRSYSKEREVKDQLSQELVKATANLHQQQRDQNKLTSECEAHWNPAEVNPDTDSSTSKLALTNENRQLRQELLSSRREYATLQQHLTSVIQTANREKTSLLDKLGEASVEKSRLELQLAMSTAAHAKDSRDLPRVRTERDAAVSEYHLVMSERDSVLRELEQLRSSVADLESKLEASERQRKDAQKEAEDARYEAETIAQSSNDIMDSAYRKEVDKLHKELARAQSELTGLQQEVDVTKQRCNWAFNERDRVLRERENMRAVCDQLRQERDSAVNQLISTLHESDDVKRQKNDIMREMKELRERYDIMLEKDMGSGPDLNTAGHHNSRDSAIDTDLNDPDMETVEVDLDETNTGEFGFSVVSGSSDANVPSPNLFFVQSVELNSRAYGKIRPNDQLLQVNGLDVGHMDLYDVMDLLHNSSGCLHLMLRRRRPSLCRVVVPFHINLTSDRHEDFGLVVEQGHIVSEIIPGSPAARAHCLSIGDQLLAVNGESVSGKSPVEVRRLLDRTVDCHISLDMLRYQTAFTPASSMSVIALHAGSPTSACSIAVEKPSQLDSVQPNQPAACSKTSSSTIGHLNFFDRAVNVIKRPFLRSRINRTTRDNRCKSATDYGSSVSTLGLNVPGVSSVSVTGDQSIVPSTNNDPADLLMCSSNSSSKQANTDGCGTWPKYRMRRSTMARPSILRLVDQNVSASPATDSATTTTATRETDAVRRSESLRHHRTQASDSVVDYNLSLMTVKSAWFDGHDARRQNSDHQQQQQQPVYFNQRRSLANDSGAKSTTPNSHVTVISHFPVDSRCTMLSSTNIPISSPGTLSDPSVVVQQSNRFAKQQQQQQEEQLKNTDEEFLDGSMSSATSCDVASYRIVPAATVHNSVSVHLLHPVHSSVKSSGTTANKSAVDTWCHQGNQPVPFYSRPSAHRRISPDHAPLNCNVLQYEAESHYSDNLFPAAASKHALTDPHLSRTDRQITADRQGRIRIFSGPVSPTSYDASHTLKRKSQFNTSQPSMPLIGDTRTLNVELDGVKPLGISIDTNHSDSVAGVFVSNVEPNSIAAQSGVVVGDQILEVCGINMRNASHQHAASVLRQLHGAVSMVIQFNPHKYFDLVNPAVNSATSYVGTLSSSTSGQQRRLPFQRQLPLGSASMACSIESAPSGHKFRPGSGSSRSSVDILPASDPRLIHQHKQYPSDPIGIELVGGNLSGIFVRQVLSRSSSFELAAGGPNEFHVGDQLLQSGGSQQMTPIQVWIRQQVDTAGNKRETFNGVDFRNITLEQAILVIRKPCSEVKCWVQFNVLKYNSTLMSVRGGDQLHLRAVRDSTDETEAALQSGGLIYKRDDILLVDNTAYSGCVGVWHAWLLDTYGNPSSTHGTIQKKVCLTDKSMRRQSLCGEMADLATQTVTDPSSEFNRFATDLRSSGSFRRSLFRRRRRRHNNESTDNKNPTESRLHTSQSDASLNSSCSSHNTATDSEEPLHFLEVVEKLDCTKLRPVILIGPFAHQLMMKLTLESPDRYCCYNPGDVGRLSSDALSSMNSLHNMSSNSLTNINVEYIKSVMQRDRHCLMNIAPGVVEFLHNSQIYPIVLFIKHKSVKQIRDVKDPQFLPDKISMKTAKDLFEQFEEYERVYRKLFSDVIAGGNLAFMCCKVKAAVDREQKKIIWIPAENFTW